MQLFHQMQKKNLTIFLRKVLNNIGWNKSPPHNISYLQKEKSTVNIFLKEK